MHVLLGVLVALTMVAACVATVVFLPALVVRLRPGFLLGGPKARVEPDAP
jgi:hypothetical protein